MPNLPVVSFCCKAWFFLTLFSIPFKARGVLAEEENYLMTSVHALNAEIFMPAIQNAEQMELPDVSLRQQTMEVAMRQNGTSSQPNEWVLELRYDYQGPVEDMMIETLILDYQTCQIEVVDSPIVPSSNIILPTEESLLVVLDLDAREVTQSISASRNAEPSSRSSSPAAIGFCSVVMIHFQGMLVKLYQTQIRIDLELEESTIAATALADENDQGMEQDKNEPDPTNSTSLQVFGFSQETVEPDDRNTTMKDTPLVSETTNYTSLQDTLPEESMVPDDHSTPLVSDTNYTSLQDKPPGFSEESIVPSHQNTTMEDIPLVSDTNNTSLPVLLEETIVPDDHDANMEDLASTSYPTFQETLPDVAEDTIAPDDQNAEVDDAALTSDSNYTTSSPQDPLPHVPEESSVVTDDDSADIEEAASTSEVGIPPEDFEWEEDAAASEVHTPPEDLEWEEDAAVSKNIPTEDSDEMDLGSNMTESSPENSEESSNPVYLYIVAAVAAILAGFFLISHQFKGGTSPESQEMTNNFLGVEEAPHNNNSNDNHHRSSHGSRNQQVETVVCDTFAGEGSMHIDPDNLPDNLIVAGSLPRALERVPREVTHDDAISVAVSGITMLDYSAPFGSTATIATTPERQWKQQSARLPHMPIEQGRWAYSNQADSSESSEEEDEEGDHYFVQSNGPSKTSRTAAEDNDGGGVFWGVDVATLASQGSRRNQSGVLDPDYSV